MRALISQAEENQRKAQDILGLYRARKDWIVEVTRSHYAVRGLDWMFQRPVFKASDFVETAGIPARTASRILGELRKQGLLRELRAASGRLPAILAFKDLLNIAEGEEAF